MAESSGNTALVVAIVIIIVVFTLIVVFACLGIQNHMSQTQCTVERDDASGQSWWKRALTGRFGGDVATKRRPDKRVRFHDVAKSGGGADPVTEDDECPVTQLISQPAAGGFESCDQSTYQQKECMVKDTLGAKRFFPSEVVQDSQKAGDASETSTMTYDKLVKAYRESNGILMGQCNTRDKLQNRHSFGMGLANRDDTIRRRVDQIQRQKMEGTFQCVQFNESPLICDNDHCENRYCG